MKRLLLPMAGILFALPSIAQSVSSDHQKAVNLVRQMTLDEKIGQMTQVTLGVVSRPQDGVLDPRRSPGSLQDITSGLF